MNNIASGAYLECIFIYFLYGTCSGIDFLTLLFHLCGHYIHASLVYANLANGTMEVIPLTVSFSASMNQVPQSIFDVHLFFFFLLS